MLVFKILSTVFIGISCFSSFIKNAILAKNPKGDLKVLYFIVWTFGGYLWRIFCIASVWML